MRGRGPYFLLCAVALASFATRPLAAQDALEPLIEVELSETEVVPGQPTILRVTVLVPTWLPKPVTFPSFEVPDLMVKLPERATSPVSRTIEGETWSGVSRGYRISPMVPGTMTVPAQELTIYWAEPGKTDPLITKSTIESVTVTGIVPKGAEALDPFIAASGLKLSEDLSTEMRELKPGDSLTRKVVLEIDGTSPLFVPKLLPPHEIQGVASYPAEPEVSETTDRTWVSGKRVESTTLVAESGGSGSVPPVEVSWYNLGTQQVEIARIEGFDLVVDGPVARTRPEVDLRLLAVVGLFGGLLAYGLFRLGRYLLPKFRSWRKKRHAAHRLTERWAYAQVQRAVQARDYGAVMGALSVWEARLPLYEAPTRSVAASALSDIGRRLFGPDHARGAAEWSALANALDAHRRASLAHEKRRQERGALLPINPQT